MSYGFTIFLKDLASSTLMKVSSGISNMESRLQSSQSKIQNNFRNTTKSIDELNAKLQRLNAQRTASTSISDIRRLKTEALQVEREIKRLEDLPPKGFGERLRSLGGQFGAHSKSTLYQKILKKLYFVFALYVQNVIYLQ